MFALSIIGDLRDLIAESYELSLLHQALSPARIIAALGTAAICGLAIYLVYRFFFRGAVYSENYGILLVLITLTTAFIINTISANIVLSLGMVGALSIVRFRSAIKDPLDVGFMFFGIAAGVTAGAGLYFPALAGTAFICTLYIIMTFIKKEKRSYLLIIRYTEKAEDSVNSLLSETQHKLKNKTKTGRGMELTIELKIKKSETDLVKKWDDIEGVESVTLLEYTGDYVN